MLGWGLGKLRTRLLEEHDVVRAHLAAPMVLAEWEARGARHWRRAFLTPVTGTVMPLVGCLLLEWSPGLVLLALTVDVAMLWLCDAAKGLLARSRVDEERAHLDEAGDVLAVIDALHEPRLPSNRDLLAPMPRRRLYLAALPSTLHDPSDRPLFIGVTLMFCVLFGAIIVIVAGKAWPWLVAGAALRFGFSTLLTLRASRDAGPRPELLPEAGIPTATLFLALYPSFLVLAGLDLDLTAIGRHNLALILIGLHLLVASGIAMLAIRRIRRATVQLRAFVGRDLAQLKQRVRQIND